MAVLASPSGNTTHYLWSHRATALPTDTADTIHAILYSLVHSYRLASVLNVQLLLLLHVYHTVGSSGPHALCCAPLPTGAPLTVRRFFYAMPCHAMPSLVCPITNPGTTCVPSASSARSPPSAVSVFPWQLQSKPRSVHPLILTPSCCQATVVCFTSMQPATSPSPASHAGLLFSSSTSAPLLTCTHDPSIANCIVPNPQ